MVRETYKWKRLDWPREYLREAGTGFQNVSTIKRQRDRNYNNYKARETVSIVLKWANGAYHFPFTRFETGKRCLSFPFYPF